MILTQDYYQRITGDDTTAAGVFASAASDAQGLLEDALGRPGMLELGERSEQLTPLPDGTLYPTCTPLVSVDGGPLFVNDTVYGATPDTNIFTGFFPGPEPWVVTLTYTGGYDSDSAPACMLRDLAWVTYALLRPELVSGLAGLAGAGTVQVGDVMVSYQDGVEEVGEIGVSWSCQTMRYRAVSP